MNNLKYYLSVLLLMAGLLLCSCQATGGPTAAPAPTGGLEGIVSDASTGQPIADAQITMAGQAGVFTIASDAGGSYRADALAEGAYLVSVQATGYYVGAIQVGVVANVVSSGNVSLTPDVVAVVTVVATPTPGSTATPAPTSTLAPTPTPLPTDMPTPIPTATPTAAPTAKPRPRATAIPAISYKAPRLVAPLDKSVFRSIRWLTFTWEGPGCLGADEYYVVSIPHPRGAEEAWVKGMTWTAPDYLYLLLPDSRELTWSVSIRRHTGEYPNGQWNGPIVSPISEVWRFSWYIEGSPASPLPTPVSPLATPAP